ncbi:MAG: carboxypeptidase regulatory-like domain-containing protein [Planctomycetes bacterium]|nr:carboxypeptidase regulatory-like domain-containing protein [Planctomycetota bacterium]
MAPHQAASRTAAAWRRLLYCCAIVLSIAAVLLWRATPLSPTEPASTDPAPTNVTGAAHAKPEPDSATDTAVVRKAATGQQSDLQLNGIVVDQKNQPVEGAQVTAVPTPPQSAVAMRTNAAGRFRTEQLPLEPVRLLVEHKDFLLANQAVPREHRSDIKIVIHRAPLIQCRVQNAQTGAPVTDFCATLAEAFEEPIPAYWSRPPDARTQHSVDGTFTLRAAASGRHLVLVFTEQFAPARVLVDAPLDAVATTEIRLQPGVQVRGILRDAAGEAVALADVTMATADGRNGNLTRTAEDGTFAMQALPLGDYELVAIHPEKPRLQQHNIHLQWDAPPPFLSLQLPAGASASGTVTPWTEGRVASVVFQHEAGPIRRASIEPQSGNYSIQDLTPGKHSVQVERREAGFRNRVARLLLDDDPATRVELPQGITTRVDPIDIVASMASLHGRVLFALPQRELILTATREDAPLPDRVSGLFRAQVMTDGSYLIDGLLAGSWRIEVLDGARTLLHESLQITAGVDVEYDLRLPANAENARR